jgi:hypothetical protein
LSARRYHLAGEEPEQRRFAGAISTDNSPSIAGFDCERNVVEQRGGTKVDAQSGRGQ